MKRILLARPSSLIVEHMKRLMKAANCAPTPLRTTAELDQYIGEEIGGIVISTALSSTVKESYDDVIKKVIKKFPGKPLFLATYTTIKRTKIIVNARFSRANLDLSLHSLEEVSDMGKINFENEMVIIRKNDISEKNLFYKTLKTVKGIIGN